MRAVIRTTWLILWFSFASIYFKVSRIGDEAITLIVPTASASITGVSGAISGDESNQKKDTSQKKNTGSKPNKDTGSNSQLPKSEILSGMNETETKKENTTSEYATVKKKSNSKPEEMRFETAKMNDIQFKVARELLAVRASRDIALFNKAVNEVSMQLVDKKIAELKKLAKTLQDMKKFMSEESKKKQKSENENVDGIARIIESMNPKQAAAMFGQLNVQIRVLLTKRIEKEKLSAILAYVDPKILTDTFESAIGPRKN